MSSLGCLGGSDIGLVAIRLGLGMLSFDLVCTRLHRRFVDRLGRRTRRDGRVSLCLSVVCAAAEEVTRCSWLPFVVCSLLAYALIAALDALVDKGTDICVATVFCDGVLCRLTLSPGAPGAATPTNMAWCEFCPVELAATDSRVRELSSLPRLLSGGRALSDAAVSLLFLLSPIRLPPMLLAPPRLGA